MPNIPPESSVVRSEVIYHNMCHIIHILSLLYRSQRASESRLESISGRTVSVIIFSSGIGMFDPGLATPELYRLYGFVS